MTIEEKIEEINSKLMDSHNRDLLAKMGEIKGLYSAYKLTNNSDILLKILEGTLDVVEMSLNSRFASRIAFNNRNNKEGELSDFYAYLINDGKTPSTADGYRKAINRVIESNGLKDLEDLNSNIGQMIKKYFGNDQAAHNTHICALKQYKCFLDSNYCSEKTNISSDYHEEFIDRTHKFTKTEVENKFGIEILKGINCSSDKIVLYSNYRQKNGIYNDRFTEKGDFIYSAQKGKNKMVNNNEIENAKANGKAIYLFIRIDNDFYYQGEFEVIERRNVEYTNENGTQNEEEFVLRKKRRLIRRFL